MRHLPGVPMVGSEAITAREWLTCATRSLHDNAVTRLSSPRGHSLTICKLLNVFVHTSKPRTPLSQIPRQVDMEALGGFGRLSLMHVQLKCS